MQVKSGQIDNSLGQALTLRFNVPNAVTTLRVALAIAAVWLLVVKGTEGAILAGVLLIVAWATDGLDGFLARRLGQETVEGALFDLTADRLLMTPILVLSIIKGFWWRTSNLMPFNPYPYAVIVIAADLTILVGILIFLWKRRSRNLEYPTPTKIAKLTYSVQLPTLIVGVLGIGPSILTAALMYLAIIFTMVAAYSYLKKGGYIFTC